MSNDKYVPRVWDIYSKAGDPKAPVFLCVYSSRDLIQGLDPDGNLDHPRSDRTLYYRGRARLERRGNSDE